MSPSESAGSSHFEFPLQEAVVYGPIRSRRLGHSLGVNFLPFRFKFCDFNCVYCQFGLTLPQKGGEKIKRAPELLGEIRKAFEHHKKIKTHVDCITIAGNGEPTLHPDFRELVGGLMKLRDELYPGVKISVLSNSSQAHRPEIREVLQMLDERYMKLDAGRRDLHKAINRPIGDFDFDRMVEGLRSLQDIVIQSLFIQGIYNNTQSKDVDLWIEKINQIHPREVHVYSISRKPAEVDLKEVSLKRLQEIAKACQSKTGWDSLCNRYQIMGFQVNGGYAEYVTVPQENIIPASSRLRFEDWAAIPLVFLTAWHMLTTRAGLQKKEKVLIHAAGSGVSSAAIQIAKYLGAFVITTVGRDAKVRPAKALGADLVINYNKKDFVPEIKKVTQDRGVDVVLEHIGPATFSRSMTCLAKKGRLVTCGVTSGPMVNIDLRFLFMRQLSLSGCYMGGLSELKKIIQLVRKKKLKPVVDSVFPLREARQALGKMQDRANFGKIILVP